MMTVLDPIWDAYRSASDALRVVRICANGKFIDPVRILARTRFAGNSETDVLACVEEAQERLDDQTVLSSYAAFEVAVREHLRLQSSHLKSHVTRPDLDFAAKLADLYEAHCDDVRMDAVEKLFRNAVGDTLVAQVGQIRTYRHWVAHGQRWKQPPSTTPMFAYTALTRFLSAI